MRKSRIQVGSQCGRKPPLSSSISSYFIIKENIQYYTSIDSYQHIGAHLEKATTFSCSPTPTGWELQPPNIIYRLLLEGNTYPLHKFTSFHQKEALNISPKDPTVNSLCEPHFIIFHTRSTCLETSNLQATFYDLFRLDPHPTLCSIPG